MATFVQMSEDDHAWGLVILLNDLKKSPEEKAATAKKIQEVEEADDEEEVDVEMDEARASPSAKLVKEGQWAALLKEAVLPAMDTLWKSDEQVIDAAFSLSFSLLDRLEAKEQEKLVEEFTTILSSDTSRMPNLRLSLLSVLFNMVGKTHRFPIFMAILAFAKTLDQLELLEGQFEHLDAWALEWELDQEQRAALYKEAAAMSVNNKKQQQIYKLEYLKAMENNKGRKAEDVRAVSASVCLAAINHFQEKAEENPCFDCNQIASLPVVQDLKADKTHGALLELTTIFGQKQVADYIAFNTKHPKFVESIGLVHEENMAKLRTVTVCSLGMDQERLSFDTLMQVLELKDADEVEAAIIDAVMSGRLQAKIDQDAGEVTVERTTQRMFSDKDWAKLSARLESWHVNVSEVLNNLRKAQLEAPMADMEEE